jgi:hypothetical protein
MREDCKLHQMPLWTQRISLSWRQNIGFFERRYEVLRILEQQGLLRRFRESNDRISVRLQGAHQLLVYGSDGLTLAALRPEADLTVLRAAMEVVCDALEPEPTGYPVFGFAWLIPCVTTYEEARATAVDVFIGAGHPGRITDFALMLDGKFDEPFDDFQLELGIVETEEIPGRLAGSVESKVRRVDAPPALWRPEDLPDVAVFCDVELDTYPLNRDGIVASMFSRFELARDSAEELMSSIMSPLDGKTI